VRSAWDWMRRREDENAGAAGRGRYSGSLSDSRKPSMFCSS
jgi:hypothetical protein